MKKSQQKPAFLFLVLIMLAVYNYIVIGCSNDGVSEPLP